jgi:hypothetical protein
VTTKILAAALGLAIFATLAGCVVAVPATPAAPSATPVAPAFAAPAWASRSRARLRATTAANSCWSLRRRKAVRACG